MVPVLAVTALGSTRDPALSWAELTGRLSAEALFDGALNAIRAHTRDNGIDVCDHRSPVPAPA